VFIRECFNDRRDDFVDRAFSRTGAGLNISLGDGSLHKRMYTRARLSLSLSLSLSGEVRYTGRERRRDHDA